jgi:hypothetical protein
MSPWLPIAFGGLLVLPVLELAVAHAVPGTLALPWEETQKIGAGDPAPGAGFGTSLAIEGKWAVVGAWTLMSGPGAAYVFVRQQNGWIEEQKLAAGDGEFDDRFGKSVGLEGDTAVVGAYLAKVEGKTHQGAVYVFERRGGLWSETQ